jgi:hypothetical protein
VFENAVYLEGKALDYRPLAYHQPDEHLSGKYVKEHSVAGEAGQRNILQSHQKSHKKYSLEPSRVIDRV